MTPTPSDIIERFPIALPNGEQWRGLLIRTRRAGGRRIQVRTPGGFLLFDTDDCFDVANATAKLDEWLTEVVAKNIRSAPTAADVRQAVRELAGV